MVGPVHHVIGGDDDERLDGLVAVSGCAGLVLLMVVGAIDVEAAVVLNGGGVGNVVEVEQGVGHALAQLGRADGHRTDVAR